MLVIVLDETLMCGGSHGQKQVQSMAQQPETDRYHKLPVPLEFNLQGLAQPTNGPDPMGHSGST